MAKGDHILVPKGPITHHGIDIGDGTVVHWYCGPSGVPGAAEVRRTPLTPADFGDLRHLQVREYGACFPPDEVVRRAMGRVGERGYCVVTNNCEHLATWCKAGRHDSRQVRDVAAAALQGPGGLAAGALVRVISATGPVPGLCARGVVAGLSALGRAAGLAGAAAPAAGLVLAAAAPAVVAAAGCAAAYADLPEAPDAERRARAAARAGGAVGAAAGAATSVGAVAAAGVPGLCAAGISSGLAALGGGSIALGLAGALCLPAAAACGAAWLAYRLWR